DADWPGCAAAAAALARETPFRRGLPIAARPVERADDDRVRLGLVQVTPARLAEPPGPRLPEPGRDRDDGGACLVADDLELMPLAHRGLVDVAREDEVCA